MTHMYSGQAMGVWSHDPSTTKTGQRYVSACQSKLLPKSLRIGKKDQRIEIFLNPEDICFSVESAFLAEKSFYLLLFHSVALI